MPTPRFRSMVSPSNAKESSAVIGRPSCPTMAALAGLAVLIPKRAREAATAHEEADHQHAPQRSRQRQQPGQGEQRHQAVPRRSIKTVGDDSLSLGEWRAYSPLFGDDVREAVSALASVRARRTPQSTNPDAVRAALDETRRWLAAQG